MTKPHEAAPVGQWAGGSRRRGLKMAIDTLQALPGIGRGVGHASKDARIDALHAWTIPEPAMRDAEPNDEDLIRLLVDSWVALHAGTLDPQRQVLLDRERPDWQCEAATLIAEGVLA
jgi:hypothetical protein